MSCINTQQLIRCRNASRANCSTAFTRTFTEVLSPQKLSKTNSESSMLHWAWTPANTGRCQSALLKLSSTSSSQSHLFYSLPNGRTMPPLPPLPILGKNMCINLSHTHGRNSNRIHSRSGVLSCSRSWSLREWVREGEGPWVWFSLQRREKKKGERLFIPYEGRIPQHAALLPQDTWGKVVGGLKTNGTKCEKGTGKRVAEVCVYV